MTKLKSSLLDYLNRRNPRVQGIHEGETTNGSTTRNLRWDFPNKLEEWDDFNLNNFDVFYDKSLQDVLKNRYDFDDLPDVPLYPFCEIRDEDSLETLLIKSIQTTVSEALTVTQADLQSQGSGDIIYMARGGHAAFQDLQREEGSGQKKSKHKRFRPDWAGVQHSDHQTKPGRNLLPGDSKLSKVFKSIDIDTGIADLAVGVKPAWYWPIAQIYTYCRQAGAPYGYLITDQELVVVHIRPNHTDTPQPATRNRRSSRGGVPSQQESADKPILEFKAIPWNHGNNSNELSVALALWWLHMIARGVAKRGDVTEGDHVHQAQTSNDPDTQDSNSTFHGFDSQEPRTAASTDSQDNDIPEGNTNLATRTSDLPQRLSEATISHEDSDNSPTAGKGGKKRRWEYQPDDDAREARRSTRRRGGAPRK